MVGKRQEGVHADVHGGVEALPARSVKIAFQVLPIGEGDSVDQDVQFLELVGRPAEDTSDLIIAGDVAQFDEVGAHGFGKGANAPLERRGGVGKRQLGAMLMQSLGDAPGDGVVIGHSEDQGPFSFEQLHWIPSWTSSIGCCSVGT